MAMINNKVIADTIIKLMRAGKQMPQADKLKAANNTQEAAQQILKQTVELFGEVFYPQKIGIERWKRAETIALTITKADALNVNLITPALMQTALNMAEQQELEIARTTYANEKEEERRGVDFTLTNAQKRMNMVLWEWTKSKNACGADYQRWLPSDQQVLACALAYGLTRSQMDEFKPMLRVFLADEKYCEACARGARLKCHLGYRRKVLKVVDDEITFGYVDCDTRGGI